MGTRNPTAAAREAVLALADIQAAVEAFNRGDVNVFEALDTIVMVVQAYAAAGDGTRRVA